MLTSLGFSSCSKPAESGFGLRCNSPHDIGRGLDFEHQIYCFTHDDRCDHDIAMGLRCRKRRVMMRLMLSQLINPIFPLGEKAIAERAN